MKKYTQSRELTKEERQRFGSFLSQEDVEPFIPFYSSNFWEDYEANIAGMAYFSCPRFFPEYFKHGDLIRILITADEYADEDHGFPSVFWWFKQNKDGTFERLTPKTISEMEDGSLVCICGNDATNFYSCNDIGTEVEPIPEAHLYCCDQCGRIFDEETRQVEGFRQPDYTYLK